MLDQSVFATSKSLYQSHDLLCPRELFGSFPEVLPVKKTSKNHKQFSRPYTSFLQVKTPLFYSTKRYEKNKFLTLECGEDIIMHSTMIPKGPHPKNFYIRHEKIINISSLIYVGKNLISSSI